MVRKARGAMSLQARSPIKRSRPPRMPRASSRRRLFEEPSAPCQGWEVEGTGPSPCPEQPSMERQDSACSTLTSMGSPSAGPATPEQPDQQPRSPPTWCAADEAPLICALQGWRRQLVALQPLVKLGDEVLLGALAAVRQLAAVRPDLLPTLHASPAYLHAFLASALWTVSKLAGVRTQIPNRSLVSQATGVQPSALTHFELELLQSLDWDIAALLRSQNLLCC